MKITFGFTTQGDDFGIMMYHRNRLIKAFEKVGYQKKVRALCSNMSNSFSPTKRGEDDLTRPS